MKTSAHPSPQADQTQPGLLPELMSEFTGTLIANAQARTKTLDHDGHMVPVLCMDLELDCALRNHMHVEQPFAADQHDACQAAAHRLRKGTRVSVEAPTVGLRMVATNTAHIRVYQPEETSA